MKGSVFFRGLYLLSLGTHAACNTEKAIFVAPETISLPNDASIDNLYLYPLNLEHRTLRTRINASFPTDSQPKGVESWFLLQDLSPGQRYEVRICWLATQPTNFWLYTHTLSDTFDTPKLLSSISDHAHAKRALLNQADLQYLQSRSQRDGSEQSLLFLQVFAAADYFTLNKTLMEDVPPVYVDIILDPFLLNVFPQSLVPTAGYIAILAVAAWFISAWVVEFLQLVAGTTPENSAGVNQTTKKKQ